MKPYQANSDLVELVEPIKLIQANKSQDRLGQGGTSQSILGQSRDAPLPPRHIVDYYLTIFTFMFSDDLNFEIF